MWFWKRSKKKNNATASEDGTQEDDGVEMDLATFEQQAEVDRAAEEQQAEEDRARRRKQQKWALVCVVLAAIVGVVVAVAVTQSNKNGERATVGDSLQASNGEAPPEIVENITACTPEETLNDLSTPQAQAFRQVLAEAGSSGAAFDGFRALQRYVLRTLYLSTSIEGWTNSEGWDEFSEDECDWSGISSCVDQAVTSIQLGNNNLDGVLPSEFRCLRELIAIELHGNKLEGPLPAGLLTIPTLLTVEMYNNQLNGTLDVLFEGVNNDDSSENLRVLDFDRNLLVGEIPEEIGEFQHLKKLHLYANDIVGEVPGDVCDLTDESLIEIVVDCDKVECDCCRACS